VERIECPTTHTSSVDHAQHDVLECPRVEFRCLGWIDLYGGPASCTPDHAQHDGVERSRMECRGLERGDWAFPGAAPASQYNPQHDVLECQGVELAWLERITDQQSICFCYLCRSAAGIHIPLRLTNEHNLLHTG
jgi:hypothetical protein